MSEEKEEFRKCDRDGCCSFLSSRIEDHGKGFHSINTINIKDFSRPAIFRGVAYKTSAKDKGLMLNFCPFCGGQPGDFKRE